MSENRFRRRTSRWRYLPAVLLLGLLAFNAVQTGDGLLDPHTTVIAAGSYAVDSITADGAIEVVVNAQSHHGLIRIALLGISITDGQRTNEALTHLIGDQPVRLRFDRRRLNDAGTLQAYVFVEDVLLNEQLIRLGCAEPDTHPADAGPMIRRLRLARQELVGEGP